MVYDCTQIYNELDLLEIRLNILDEHVDWFVILEADETFSGKPKPLYFKENKERFKKWQHKIIHFTIEGHYHGGSFQRAAYQKDSIRKVLGEVCKPDDTIYYGDVDEIWTPQKEEGKLRQLNYSYYLNNRSSEDWQGTNVFKYKNIKDLNEIRADHTNILENGGFHFTNMGGADQIRLKLEAYDHAEFDTPEIKSMVSERIKNGEDYVGRKYDWKGVPFSFWVDEKDLPIYLLENKERWSFLFKNDKI